MSINRQVFPIDADVAVAPTWTMDGPQFAGEVLQALFVPDSAETLDSGAGLKIEQIVDSGRGYLIPVFAADSVLGAPLFLHQPGQQGEVPVVTPTKRTAHAAPHVTHEKAKGEAKEATATKEVKLKTAQASYGDTKAAVVETAEPTPLPAVVLKELGMTIYSATESLRVTVTPGGKVKGSLFIWTGMGA